LSPKSYYTARSDPGSNKFNGTLRPSHLIVSIIRYLSGWIRIHHKSLSAGLLTYYTPPVGSGYSGTGNNPSGTCPVGSGSLSNIPYGPTCLSLTLRSHYLQQFTVTGDPSGQLRVGHGYRTPLSGRIRILVLKCVPPLNGMVIKYPPGRIRIGYRYRNHLSGRIRIRIRRLVLKKGYLN